MKMNKIKLFSIQDKHWLTLQHIAAHFHSLFFIQFFHSLNAIKRYTSKSEFEILSTLLLVEIATGFMFSGLSSLNFCLLLLHNSLSVLNSSLFSTCKQIFFLFSEEVEALKQDGSMKWKFIFLY